MRPPSSDDESRQYHPTTSKTATPEDDMYEIYDRNPDAMNAELAYRRALLTGTRSQLAAPRGRWWRRRNTRSI
jgi:hypothetical protein